MVFENLKKDLAEADADVRSYLENSEEYFKLKSFKIFMRAVTVTVKTALIGSIGAIALFILSLAACYGIGEALGNTSQGFLIVGLFYVLLGIICYILRDKLNAPLLKKFSEIYFD